MADEKKLGSGLALLALALVVLAWEDRGGEAFLAAGKDKKVKEEGVGLQAKFGGFTAAQLEEMYAFFKEKESHERRRGKSYYATSTSWVLDGGASHHMINNA